MQNLYTEQHVHRPKLDNLSFNSNTERNREQLADKFTEKEILDCLRESDGDKAPGPDGFNFKFLQTFWDLIKGNVTEIFNDFHSHNTFVRSLNFTFLVMIPKRDNPKSINDFRPISLIGCIYKLLYKVLARRFSKVLDKIISHFCFRATNFQCHFDCK